MANKLHIDNWITKAEPDYYTMFIKAWIPFNAWYFTEYSTKQDNVALEKIKTTKNKVRNRLEALLLNTDKQAKDFRHHLAQLHFQLESRRIMNYGSIVSFCSIVIDGYLPPPATDTDKKGNVYKAIPNKNTGYRAIIVSKSGKSLMDKTFNPYNIKAFLLDTQYVALGDRNVQEKIRLCFERINPLNSINLVSKSRVKSDFIVIDEDTKINFINDTELIAQGIIQHLYILRCLLFHGELDPTDTNQSIYEHAFNILMPIIQELR